MSARVYWRELHTLESSTVTTQTVTQNEQIFAALEVAPLDRVKLMKVLFLAWHRTGKSALGPFHFQPYLYGPCAFDLYSRLDGLETSGLVRQMPHPVARWSPYHLTEAGHV